ncbi:NUDIX domain-containing protein [Planctomycetota bacterium]
MRDRCYCLPGGHIRRGETFEAAARRETMEELGINLPVCRSRVRGRRFWTSNPDAIPWISGRRR